MLQTPVNYCGTPCQVQPSYNAVKIDIHNPKVMDGQPQFAPTYPSAYAMPTNSCYAPQTNGMPCYPQMPQVNPNMGYIPQQAAFYPQQPISPMPQPTQVVNVPQQQISVAPQQQQTIVAPQQQQTIVAPQQQQTIVAPQQQQTFVAPQQQQTYIAPQQQQAYIAPQQQQTFVAPQQQQAFIMPQQQVPVQQPISVAPQPVPVVPQPIPVIAQPLPVAPAPIQQVINNGVPQSQTIVQTPAQDVKSVGVPTTTTTVTTPASVATVATPTVTVTNPVEIQTPQAVIKPVDISAVLKGLQSTNLAEQSEALNTIGEAGNNPEEIKKYLETSVLDSLLGILNADTKNLQTATPEQIEARTKWMNEIDLPDNEKTMTEKEKELAMTLAPQEVADKNKQHAMYSIAIIQKALSDAIEEKTGEKIGIEKLPAIDQIVNVVKANPNPLLRASGIVALAHLNKPEYKPVLNDIFTIAKNDQDPNVKQVAEEALNKINGVEQAK